MILSCEVCTHTSHGLLALPHHSLLSRCARDQHGHQHARCAELNGEHLKSGAIALESKAFLVLRLQNSVTLCYKDIYASI